MAQVDSRTVLAVAATVALCVGAATTASAQTRLRPYVGASFGSFSLDTEDVDGRSASAGLLAGVTVSRFVDVEVDAVFPTGSFTRHFTGVLVSFAPQGSTREEIERFGVVSESEWRHDIRAVVSTVAIIHPATKARAVPALVAGVTFRRTQATFRSRPLVIPAGVNPQHPSVAAQEDRRTKTESSPTIGGQVAIRVAPRLHVVPDVRFDYNSLGDEINNALRTSVRAVVTF
jgi:hypothetical protein